MFFFKQLNKNYFIYFILIFVFIPINFIPQLFDGVFIEYAYETRDLGIVKVLYKEAGRYFHLFIIYLVYFLAKYTSLPAEIFLDNLLIVFLILFCIEVKKYSKLFFGLETKWCNLAALFTAIFPVWHTLVDFDIGQYLISIYFLFFGFRNFISPKKINIIVGLVFIVLSFNVESNLSLIVGLATIYLLLNKANNTYDFSVSKLIIIIAISVAYYIMRYLYFSPSGLYENYNIVTWDMMSSNLTLTKLIKNIFNYSTYLLLYLWIPIIFFLHILFINNKYSLKEKLHFKYNNNYFLLIILSGFAIFPYLLLNKSSSILYLSDYYQRHAFLLAPISGMFFSIMFRDMGKINCLQYKINLNFYLIIFICINLALLNYGNYRKTESYLFRSNLIQELKAFGTLPKGNVQFIGKNIPADFRVHELNHLLYKAYDIAGWWSTPFGFNENEIFYPPSNLINNKKYSNYYISSEYKYECNIYIYLKNDLKIIERLKQFYIFNYKNYYNIGKIVKKC